MNQPKSAEEILKRHSFPDDDNGGYSFTKESVIAAMHEFAAQSAPQLPTKEELYDIGKAEIDYDRQLELSGKKDADGVLFFWMEGAEFILNRLKEGK